MRLQFRTISVVLLLCAPIAGCVHDEKRAGVDMQSVANKADEIMDATLKDIEPEVQWAHGPTTTGSCSVTRRRTVMTIVSEMRRGNFLGMVERNWGKREYWIKGVNNDVHSPAIYARTGDGFGVALIIGDSGQVFFEVDSPCVRESAVTESTTSPNGPAYEGVYPLPRPNVRSDFWSAGAP